MTRKIKNLLLAALFAVSPFASMAQAQTETTATDAADSAVEVLDYRSIRLTASSINFGVIGRGALEDQANEVILNCLTDIGTVTFAGPRREQINGQCGEIVVTATGAEAIAYNIAVSIQTIPTTESRSDGAKDAIVLLSVYPEGEDQAILGSIARSSPKNTDQSFPAGAAGRTQTFKIGGGLFLTDLASGVYVGAYTVEVTLV